MTKCHYCHDDCLGKHYYEECWQDTYIGVGAIFAVGAAIKYHLIRVHSVTNNQIIKIIPVV